MVVIGTPFIENLREALSRVPSVSQFCREIALNRQQMNKYLSGQNRPSPYNMQRIAARFGIDPSDFALDPSEFRRLVERRFGLSEGGREVTLPEDFRHAFTDFDRDLARFQGYYRCYIRSSTWPGFVLCYILRIYRSGAWIQSKSVGRYHDPETGNQYLMKSHGVLTMQGDSIFLMERERIGVPRMSATVLEQSYRTSGIMMRGITIDMPITVPRRAVALPIVFVFVGPSADRKKLLRQSGVLAPDSRKIDPRVRRMLNEPVTNY